MHFSAALLSALAISSNLLGSTVAFQLSTQTSVVTRSRRTTELYSKKILLCFDGTGNNARHFQPNEEKDTNISNVLKLHLLAGGDLNEARNDVPGQISLYSRGIGARSTSSFIRKLRKTGGDLTYQTKPMKKRLQEVYEKGDKLYFLGFSRGASSARVVASDIFKEGLVCSKTGDHVQEPPIEFMGCFDTVSMQIKKRLIKIAKTAAETTLTPSTVLKEDGQIAPNIKKAVHNVVLDDNRMWGSMPTFPPVLMGEKKEEGQERVTEVWFPGAHGDGGGTYFHRGLADGSLKFMQEFMMDLEGDGLSFLQPIEIHPEALELEGYPEFKITSNDLAILPDPAGRMHNDEDQQVSNPSPRPICVVHNDKMVEGATVKIHESVLHHMEAMKKAGKKYEINPYLKTSNFVVVTSLGKVLEKETKTLIDLLASDYE